MSILWLALTVAMASLLGRSMFIWGFLGYAVGWPAMIILLMFGMKAKTWENRLGALQDIIDKTKEESKPKEYKDFNNVQDLFSQLDKK